MAKKSTFKVENQLWKQRAKHGRDTIFADAKAMWEAACEYFEWCDNNPFYEHDIKPSGKVLKEVSIPRKRPYTIQGLCIFWGVATAYLRQFKNGPNCPTGSDFSTVISQIEDVIYKQKFEGAASGFFNANIISRDLGLADKKEVDANVNLKDRPIEFE
jgi:hypothetical protein